MPKWLEEKLSREADKKGLTGKHKQAYIHGTMYEIEHGTVKKRKKRRKRTSKR